MILNRSNITLIFYFLITIILSFILYTLLLPYPSSIVFIENFQLILLFLGMSISIRLAIILKKYRLFWFWAATWWIVLLGRSINWGRLYYPEFPHEYYRIIGAILISSLLIPFFITQYRTQLVSVIKKFKIPFKTLIVLTMIFLIIDQIEQNRYFYVLLTHYIPISDDNLLEEIIEVFFIIGLFEFIAFYYAKIYGENRY